MFIIDWEGKGTCAIVSLTWKKDHHCPCRMIRNGPLKISRSLKKAENGPMAKISSLSLYSIHVLLSLTVDDRIEHAMTDLSGRGHKKQFPYFGIHLFPYPVSSSTLAMRSSLTIFKAFLEKKNTRSSLTIFKAFLEKKNTRSSLTIFKAFLEKKNTRSSLTIFKAFLEKKNTRSSLTIFKAFLEKKNTRSSLTIFKAFLK